MKTEFDPLQTDFAWSHHIGVNRFITIGRYTINQEVLHIWFNKFHLLCAWFNSSEKKGERRLLHWKGHSSGIYWIRYEELLDLLYYLTVSPCPEMNMSSRQNRASEICPWNSSLLSPPGWQTRVEFNLSLEVFILNGSVSNTSGQHHLYNNI